MVVLLVESQFFVVPDFALLASVRREPGHVDAWAATSQSPASSTDPHEVDRSASSGLPLAFPSELEASIKAVATGSCVYLWARL